MVKKLTALIVLSLLPGFIYATEWSRFVTTTNRDDVVISFRQKKVNSAWSVEWQVNNKSSQTIEPFLKFRHYLCDDDSTLKFTKSTLGIYPPGSQRHSNLTDTGVCSNSKIKLVEIETEIIENHDTTSPN